MDSEPSVNQDIDLEIEGGGVELESIDPGMVEAMEVEEEEDVNGDVIRCLCNEIEEGGFMIQVLTGSFLSVHSFISNIKEQILLSWPHTFLIKLLRRSSLNCQENSPWVILALILLTSEVE